MASISFLLVLPLVLIGTFVQKRATIAACQEECSPETFLHQDKDLLAYGEKMAALLCRHAKKVGWKKVENDCMWKKFGATFSSKQKIATYCSLSNHKNTSMFLSELGSAYRLLGSEVCAKKAFEQGVQCGVWSSTLHRPLLQYCKGLNDVPWVEEEHQSLRDSLESNCLLITDELLKNSDIMSNNMSVTSDNIGTFSGSWKTLILFDSENGGVQNISQAFQNTVKATINDPDVNLVKLSKLMPGTRIRPHSGPTNCQLRTHLTLYHTGGARIRVGEEWKEWKTCRAFTFNSAFEHEVIHEGEEPRVVVIVDKRRI